VTPAVLGDRLFLFGIYDTGMPPESEVVVVASTADTVSWTPWILVEPGARPEDRPPPTKRWTWRRQCSATACT
jgi:hypothetical protein